MATGVPRGQVESKLQGLQCRWPLGMSLRGSCPKASRHSSQDRGVPRYVCLPKESRGKDCSHFRGRQVQHPRVKSTPEDPLSSVRPATHTAST